MKKCSSCKEMKSFLSFNKDKTTITGLHKYCKLCNRKKAKERYAKNRKILIDKQKNYANTRKEFKKAYDKAHYEANSSRKKELHRKWIEKNRERVRELNYLRKKRLRIAMLKGTEDQILEFYRNRPKGCHIDHIIPLNGENVCGLHVPWNLQYLSAKDNLSKGNRVIS